MKPSVLNDAKQDLGLHLLLTTLREPLVACISLNSSGNDDFLLLNGVLAHTEFIEVYRFCRFDLSDTKNTEEHLFFVVIV